MATINHKLIRQVIQVVGITIFLVSIFFKLKAIFLMGGTKSMSDEPENDDDDDDDSDSEAPTPAVTGRSDPDDTAD